MKTLANQSPAKGSNVNTKRVGRGIGSGMGKRSTRGGKGQTARTGGRVRAGFEGGQTPLYRRLPKVGFTNIHQVKYQVLNLDQLEGFDNGAEVTPQVLLEKGLVKSKNVLIKILGKGKLTKSLKVRLHKFSESAKNAIGAAGGKAEEI